MSTQKIAFDEKLQISKDKLDEYDVLNIAFYLQSHIFNNFTF